MTASSPHLRTAPWLDRSGRGSLLKAAVFAALFVPGLWMAWAWQRGLLGPKPVTEVIHGTGLWAVRILLLSLLVTPLRRLAHWNRVILIRRMLGLGVLAYLLIHVMLYALSLGFDLVHVASEVVFRVYLLIGFVALVGFCVLGSTSTDGAIRRIGPERWNGLHRTVYLLTALGLLHFFMQAKLDVTQPTLMAGVFVLLMGHRLLTRLGLGDRWPALTGLAIVAGCLTALMEAGWYRAASGVPAARVLEANLDVGDTLRPAWWVLGAGLILVAIRLSRPLWSRKPRDAGRVRPARATA